MRTLHTKQFTIGNTVRCSDGPCGHLRRVVIEPVDCVLTHLVVKPEHRDRACRLVPLGIVESSARGAAEQIMLHCSLAEFEAFERALEMYFLAGASGRWGYRQEQMLTWPYYRLGLGGGPAGGTDGSRMRVGTAESATDPVMRTSARDRVPVGRLRVRRGDRIQAVDGSIGRVQGLVVDQADHQVTHVLLDESHLWDQKRAAIPIGSVINLKDMTDGVRINLTKDQVSNLPLIELDVQE